MLLLQLQLSVALLGVCSCSDLDQTRAPLWAAHLVLASDVSTFLGLRLCRCCAPVICCAHCSCIRTVHVLLHNAAFFELKCAAARTLDNICRVGTLSEDEFWSLTNDGTCCNIIDPITIRDGVTKYGTLVEMYE